MNRAKVFAVLAAFIMVWIAGCGSNGGNIPKPIELTQEGFPKSMVGIWQADAGRKGAKWAIKFEEDGSIRRIIHAVAGPVKLEEGGVFGLGPEESTYCSFTMGPCEARYDPRGRKIDVKIIVEDYQMQLPQGLLEGRIEDYFTGPVSQDGKTWEVKWVSYAWLEGSSPPDPNIIDAEPTKLTFSKMDPNDPNSLIINATRDQ